MTIIERKPKISIVIPVYNSADIFPRLYERLIKTLEETKKSFEIIAVIDGTADGSADVVAEYCAQDPRVKMLEMSRNFGEQAATTAGLMRASGDMIITMDDDLEDPPEVIAEFVAKAEEGYDVVYGIIRKRHTSSLLKFFYFAFYRVLNILIDTPFPKDAGSFCLMRRCVVDALNTMPENNRYIRGLRAWAGFHQIGLEYEREERYAGQSGYNLTKYFGFASNAILSFSYKPLMFMTWMGFLFACISFILAIRIIIRRTSGLIEDVPGWTSLMVMITFLGGIQLASIGILGQYIGRIYDEVKKRPPYIVKRALGFKDDNL